MSENKIIKNITRSLIIDNIAHMATIDLLLRKIETNPNQEDLDALIMSLDSIDKKIEKLKLSILNSLKNLDQEEAEVHFEEDEDGKKIL
jgi:hypothetical protein